MMNTNDHEKRTYYSFKIFSIGNMGFMEINAGIRLQYQDMDYCFIENTCGGGAGNDYSSFYRGPQLKTTCYF
ncbi:MAG: hypothetical protein SVK54_01490 [candidate division WOR-3 bacterium]|nr:hypothetical protein [candidate division WOR-3 bacterium]